MPNLEKLFSQYDRLVLFDTETTGLQYSRDEIIEFAAVAVERGEAGPGCGRRESGDAGRGGSAEDGPGHGGGRHGGGQPGEGAGAGREPGQQ